MCKNRLYPNEPKKGVLGDSGAFDNEARYDCDQAIKGDIDFEGMLREDRKRLVITWEKMQAFIASSTEGCNSPELYWSYGMKSKDDPAIHDLDLYVAQRAGFSTYAVVKDGEWYEKGKMGWFGMASDEKDRKEWNKEFRQLIADLPDETLLTVLDCHI